MIKKIIYIFFVVLFSNAIIFAESKSNYKDGSVFINFDEFVPTTEEKLPDNSKDGWVYSSNLKKENIYLSSTCGWFDTKKYADFPHAFNFFKKFKCDYNNAHMGFETFGFLEIDPENALIGNSLKYVTTGGINSSGKHGQRLHSKDEYLRMKAQNVDIVAMDGQRVGHPYLYFMNNTMNQGNLPFPEAKGKNRLSFYVKMPGAVNNSGTPPNSPQPSSTMSIGPYNGNGSHWYHTVYNRGGGWTHVVIDGHPNHNNSFNNAASYPYPSFSLRDMDMDYFQTMYAFYITFSSYEGIAVPPYEILIDEIEFYHDSEPQNNETINSPAVTFYDTKNVFEIGFSDKYKNNKDSWSSYEVKYSFDPITNKNYDNISFVTILEDSRFKGVSYNENGFFKKVWPYYQAVWAPFRIKKTDENRLIPGKKIYFAVKDLSKRPYEKGNFDEDGDTQIVEGSDGKRRIDLIKRIDYIIPKKGSHLLKKRNFITPFL